ncbi:histidine triad nucleotide-binding protein [bacterium]|nr:histidine triad nucleotide-binding protein [bacterium]
MQDCIFCKIVRGEIPTSLVYCDDEIVAFRDTTPQAPTHVLVVPRRHISSLNDLTAEEMPLLGKLLQVCREVAKKEGVFESGYRIAVNTGPDAGQVVEHIHFHVLGGGPMNLEIG